MIELRYDVLSSYLTPNKEVAFSLNFSKLHHKYNRNLIADSEQELETHLRKRRRTSKRYSLLAQRADVSEAATRTSPTTSQPLPQQATSEAITSIYTRQVMRTNDTDKAGVVRGFGRRRVGAAESKYYRNEFISRRSSARCRVCRRWCRALEKLLDFSCLSARHPYGHFEYTFEVGRL